MRSRQAPEAGALLLVAGCVLTFTVLYGGAAWLGDGFSTRYRLYFEWERNIPLVPAAAFVYLSVFLTYLPVLRELPSARALKPVAWTLLAEQLIAVLCFLLLPLEDGFPTAPPPAGLSGAVWRFAGQLAMRHNYLPSGPSKLNFSFEPRYRRLQRRTCSSEVRHEKVHCSTD